MNRKQMKRGEKYIVLRDRFTHFTNRGAHAVRGVNALYRVG